MVTIMATDGSSLRDDQTSTGDTFICAGGFVLEVYDQDRIVYKNSDVEYLGRSTSNKAEFTGLIRGLEEIHSHGIDEKSPVLIVSDSEYVINCVTEWYSGWREKEIRTGKRPTTKEGTPIKNYDLIRKAYTLFYSLRNGGTFLKIHSHMNKNDYGKEYKKFKKRNNYACSYELFTKFRILNEQCDALVHGRAQIGKDNEWRQGQ